MPGTIGKLLANTEARIVDVESGRDAEPGAPGEIWVRGPQVMLGYLDDDEATAHTLDAEGWLRTGDIGVYDDEGGWRVVDRLKELIKFKGYQVPPAMLEAVLLTHPAVVDACVIPVADEEAGEIPKAFVVVRHAVDGDELIAFVAGAGRSVRAGAGARVHRRDPQVGLGQAAAPGAGRARAREAPELSSWVP